MTGSKSGSGGNPSGGGTSAINVTPDPVNFGNVTVGSKDTQTIQLSNTGTADLTVTKVQAAGGGFGVAGLSLPLTLTAGQTISFTSSFKPTGTGNSSGSISFTSNADGSPMIVDLSGVGTTTTAQLSPNSTSLSFGNVTVGTTSAKDVNFTNTGNSAVTITNVSVAGTGFAVSGGNNITLSPNQSTNVAVTFDPKAAGGVQGTLSVSSNAPIVEIPLSGQGMAQVGGAATSVTPNPVNFGNVTLGSKNSQTMQLSNPGTADLTVTKVQATGAGFSVGGLSLPLTLSAGKSTSFTSSFKPTATGNSSGSISITSNADGSPMMVSLSGAGTTSTVQLTPSLTSISFGKVTVGTTSTKDVKLTNTGNTDVAITNVSVAGTGLAASGGTNVTLAPNQSTDIAVSFDPASTVGVQGTLSISSNAQPLQIPVSGQGTAQAVQHSVSLKWSPSTSVVSGYNVYRGTVPGGPYGRLNGSIDTSASYTDQAVASSKTYYYVVTSVGTDNVESAYSSPVSVTIPSP